jgi:hypothetical protein
MKRNQAVESVTERRFERRNARPASAGDRFIAKPLLKISALERRKNPNLLSSEDRFITKLDWNLGTGKSGNPNLNPPWGRSVSFVERCRSIPDEVGTNREGGTHHQVAKHV